MKLFQSTKKWSDWWIHRKLDWNKDYLQTWNHPHRHLISSILKTFNWVSLLEIGCGAGPNLVNIVKSFPNKVIQLGGIDLNEDAIKLAKEVIKGGMLKVGSGKDIMMSDDSTDVVLTDMSLIYVSPWKINDYIKEIKRIARSHVILCEFHSDSFYDRIKLKWNSGYNAYNYKKLLEKHGFYDITLYKIPEEAWPGGEPQKTFGYIIKAKLAPRKVWN